MSHLKRLTAPKTWRIPRKDNKYITRPFPGGHSYDAAMSINEVLIALNLADNKREVRHALNNKKVLIDGKQKFNVKNQIGFMDVLSVPGSSYRVVIGKEGLQPIEIDSKEAGVKPLKIVGKTKIKGKKIQLNTHDGRNINIEKDTYKVGDTIIVEVPSQKVKDHFKLEKGSTILLYKGQYMGAVGKIESIEGEKLVFTVDKDKFETRKAYAFVVGKDKPVVKIAE